MSPARSIGAVVVLVTLQLCAGEETCTVWSNAGSVVQQGSNFTVYCSFKCTASRYPDNISMYRYDSETNEYTEQHLEKHNSTTVSFKVDNITESKTYSCNGECQTSVDPCGLDMKVGYPPDRPTNILCVNRVLSHERSTLTCTWSQGRDTKLPESAELHVRSRTGSSTVTVNTQSKERNQWSANVSVSAADRVIEVWVRTWNALGSEVSAPVSYVLWDIGWQQCASLENEYHLSAVPPAPVLGQPNCSSRECVLQVQQSIATGHLQVEYRADSLRWTPKNQSGVHMMNVTEVRLSPLEPYSSYRFRVRCRFATGLWSAWSAQVSGQTEEEAPAKELDVWYAAQGSDSKSLRVYWKKANASVSRGKVTRYTVRVHGPHSGLDKWMNLSADLRSCLVPFCADCEVTVWSHNSKGASPPARMSTRHRKDDLLELQFKTLSNHSVSISWRRYHSARQQAGLVVEFYPEGHKQEELRWVRLGRNDSSVVLTGLEPFECYSGSVYVIYDDGPGNQITFARVATLESVPAAVRSVQERVEDNSVRVSWAEVPRGQRGGCVTNYTLYLESDSGWSQAYHVLAPQTTYTIKDLPAAMYSLWVTASTAQGEGPKGQRSKVKFFIQYDAQMSLLLIFVAVIPVIALICLFKVPAVKQRIWRLFQFLALDHVPDPANSKWAKECTQETGKVKLQLQLSNCSMTEEEEDEEDPIVVDVEELPKPGRGGDSSPEVTAQLLAKTRALGCDTQPEASPYPVTTYIKSSSHNSESSSNTESSAETGTTVDYISSHRPAHMDEEYLDEEEDEDNFGFTMDFFPTAIKGLQIGGKLTLDAVKVNCSNYFQSEHC